MPLDISIRANHALAIQCSSRDEEEEGGDIERTRPLMHLQERTKLFLWTQSIILISVWAAAECNEYWTLIIRRKRAFVWRNDINLKRKHSIRCGIPKQFQSHRCNTFMES